MSVIVIGEADGSALKPVSQQAAALATQLGDSMGLVFGSTDAAGKLAAARVVSVPRVKRYDALQFAAVAAQVARKSDATCIVMAATAMGKDLGPRLAAELGWSYIADALEYDGGAWIRPNYAGKVLARLEPDGPFVVTLRPNAPGSRQHGWSRRGVWQRNPRVSSGDGRAGNGWFGCCRTHGGDYCCH